MLTFWRLWREYRRSGLSVRRAAHRAWQTVYSTWAMDQYLRSLDGSLRDHSLHDAGEPSQPRSASHRGPRPPSRLGRGA